MQFKFKKVEMRRGYKGGSFASLAKNGKYMNFSAALMREWLKMNPTQADPFAVEVLIDERSKAILLVKQKKQSEGFGFMTIKTSGAGYLSCGTLTQDHDIEHGQRFDYELTDDGLVLKYK